MKLQQITTFFAKMISQFCMVVFLVLFAAAAEGTLSVVVALVLGAANLVVLNALCGMLLAKPAVSSSVAAEEDASQVVYHVRHRSAPVALRLVRGNRVA